MEMRLCNIFKTTKAIILTNTITENPYKVLLDSSKRTASPPLQDWFEVDDMSRTKAQLCNGVEGGLKCTTSLEQKHIFVTGMKVGLK